MPSYTDSGLTSGAVFQYRVTPTSVFGDGVPSITSGATRLQQVTGLAFDSVTSSQTQLRWTDIPTETNYRIERSTDGTTFTQIGTVAANVTNYADTTVLPTTEYYYRVLGTAGQSEASFSYQPVCTTSYSLQHHPQRLFQLHGRRLTSGPLRALVVQI